MKVVAHLISDSEFIDGTALPAAGSILELQKRSREMIQASRLSIIVTRTLIVQTKKIIAASNKSITALRRECKKQGKKIS